MPYLQKFVFDSPMLCVFYLGGKVEGCNIEMHDVVFAVGKSDIEISQKIKNKWCGIKTSLHVDSWFILASLNGFDVKITEIKPQSSTNHLYFVNLGSYKRNFFGENHFITFVVAQSRSQAIEQARREVSKGTEMLHTDNIYDIDECIRITEVDNYHIVLEYTGIRKKLSIINGYQQLN